jgi:hypothetical protein
MKVIELGEAESRRRAGVIRDAKLGCHAGHHFVDRVAIDAHGSARGERSSRFGETAVRASGEISDQRDTERRRR